MEKKIFSRKRGFSPPTSYIQNKRCIKQFFKLGQICKKKKKKRKKNNSNAFPPLTSINTHNFLLRYDLLSYIVESSRPNSPLPLPLPPNINNDHNNPNTLPTTTFPTKFLITIPPLISTRRPLLPRITSTAHHNLLVLIIIYPSSSQFRNKNT